MLEYKISPITDHFQTKNFTNQIMLLKTHFASLKTTYFLNFQIPQTIAFKLSPRSLSVSHQHETNKYGRIQSLLFPKIISSALYLCWCDDVCFGVYDSVLKHSIEEKSILTSSILKPNT